MVVDCPLDRSEVLGGRCAIASPGNQLSPNFFDAESTEVHGAEGVAAECAKMLEEFKSAADVKEALLCCADIRKRGADAEAARDGVVTAAVEFVISESALRVAELVGKLLVALCGADGYGADVVSSVMNKAAAALEDTAIDTPMAPKLMASMLAALIRERKMPAEALRTAAEACADPITRVDFAAAVVGALKGSPVAYADCKKLDLPSFLVGDDVSLDDLKKALAKAGAEDALAA